MEEFQQSDKEMQTDGLNTQNSKGKRQEIDWGKYGLSEKSSYERRRSTGGNSASQNGVTSETLRREVKELFEEEGEHHQAHEPWWKTSFFITRTLLFGTWDGVFTTCLMNIVGVVIFLRTGWMVGYAGIGLSLLIVVISLSIALATVMSAVGICDRCDVTHGGVYFIVSHVLGGKIGGSVGLLYCLGNAVATAMYCIGFAESLSSLVGWNNTWAIRSIGLVVLLALLAIAISGVKWVIRFQLVLVLILAVAVMDFVIGTLVHDDPVDGFTGFSHENFKQNSKPMFTGTVHFFTVFGVFFPAACGVMSGVNMSGDLKDPGKSIPIGSAAALGVTGGFYVIFIFLLGATCTRGALRADSMIMQKISVIGFLFLLGLYVSSLSSILGGVVGPPRVLQTIAQDNILPVLKPFSKRGSNNEPQNATFLLAFVVILFILIGKLNTLATIATMPFLLTYIAINYSYFALSLSYDLKKQEKRRQQESEIKEQSLPTYLASKDKSKPSSSATDNKLSSQPVEKTPLIADCESYGSREEDLEAASRPFQKQSDENGIHNTVSEDRRDSIEIRDASSLEINGNDKFGSKKNMTATVSPDGCRGIEEPQLEFVKNKEPDALYSKLCNRWVSLLTSGISFALMFCISWTYSLASISIFLLLYIFISQSNPGLSRGVAYEFSFSKWVKAFGRLKSDDKNERQIVVHRGYVPYGISMYQMTQDNSDYALRDRKHHSSVITKPVPYD